MVTLGAYLSVFDWNLIWLVEYSDLAKLMLVGTAIFSSIATTFIYQIQDAYSWLVRGSTFWKGVLISGVVIAVVIQIGLVVYDIRSENGFEFYHAIRAVTSVVFIFLLFLIFRDYSRLVNGEFIPVTNLLAGLTILLATVGLTYGTYVKDVSRQTHEVITTSGDFPKAKIIMFLSHHVAFVADGNVIVLPTTAVTKITSRIL